MIYELIYSFFEFIFGADILVFEPYQSMSVFFSWLFSSVIFSIVVLAIPLAIVWKLLIKRRWE